MNDYTLVERILPARVLTEIGIYIQSAAHLELAVWKIVMYSDGEFNPTNEKLLKYLEVKKTTPKLLTELKNSTRKLPAPIAVRVSILASKIEAGLQNRNTAAHGAFFSENGALMVSHYWPVGKGGNRQWFQSIEPISRRMIVQAIEEIDVLLREAVSIRKDLVALSKEKGSEA